MSYYLLLVVPPQSIAEPNSEEMPDEDGKSHKGPLQVLHYILKMHGGCDI